MTLVYTLLRQEPLGWMANDIAPLTAQARCISAVILIRNGALIPMASAGVGVVHIVLFKWKETATPEAIAQVEAELRAMQGQIEGVLDISCGTDFSGRSQGFATGLVVHFTDRAALEAYGPHPVHQRVVQTFINPIRADVLAFDYEV
jgi:hypothetical protein